jgi:uncharacterized RDD family membrane protein YckC
MSEPWVTVPQSVSDPTAVIGRRIGAWALDVVLVLVLAGGAGAIVWFSSATLVEGAGESFCERINDTAPDLGDPVAEVYDVGYSCLQLNDDAYVASNDDTRRAFMAGILIALLIPLNLFIVQGLTGASVGKHLFGLRVVRATGQIAGFGWNALRTLLLLVATFPCGIVLMPAELIVAAVTKRHQRVGDMAAGCYVVRRASVGTPIDASGTITGAPAPVPASTWGVPTAPAPSATWGTPPPTWGTTPPSTPSPTPEGSATPSGDETPGDTPATGAAGIALAPSPAAGGPTPADAAAIDDPESGVPAPLTPSPAAASAAPPAGTPALPPGAEMRWDERWNAWLYWDPNSQRWLRHDPAANQWIPL